jgi:hypothetical protein
MAGREKITELLNQTEKELKELEIYYEQYFMGVEKRSPEQQRHKFTVRLRKMITYYIPQTDLRYRLNGISSRFNSYCSYWDRIQRLIDEGRYERHTSKIQRRGAEISSLDAKEPQTPVDPVDSLYEKLVHAHQLCALRPPNREQVSGFLVKQAEAIKEKFGDREVDFVVVTEAGKPKIKVKAKN